MSAPEPQAPPGFSAMAQALLDDVARLGAGQEQVSEMLLLACATGGKGQRATNRRRHRSITCAHPPAGDQCRKADPCFGHTQAAYGL